MFFLLILQDSVFSYKSPTKAITLSLLAPGGGQFYNNKKTKFFIISLLDISSASLFLYNTYKYQKYKTENYYWSSISYFITFLSIKLFSAIDAYVDANIKNASKSQEELKEKIF
ncbi:MAG: DUF5683 domain-containing protein [candidate division WOR-3 bacterium]